MMSAAILSSTRTLTVVLALGAAGMLRAEEAAKLTVADAPPPKEVAEAIRAALDHQVIRLAEKDKVFFEFWFRKEIPVDKKPGEEDFGVAEVKEGTLLGVLKVHQERFDFREEEIPPGVYTLRIGIQPEDGDHLGTSPTSIFAMLIPAKDDQDLKRIEDHDDLTDVSSTINAVQHPSSLNLQPAEEAGEKFPRLASHQDDEHKVVYLRLRGKIEGGDTSVPLIFALVYEGIGDI